MPGFKKQIYSEQVADYIKQCMIEGELSPGDKVKELTLAGKLKISRAPIREALQILVREGLLTSEPQKGKYIKKLNAKQIKDSYFTGGILEGAAIAQTAHLLTPADFSALEKLIKKMQQLAHKNKGKSLQADIDDKFHKILFSKTDNQFLKELSRRSCHNISKFLFYKYWKNLFTLDEFHSRHQTIFDSVKTDQPWQIEECIRQHYIEIGERMAKYGEEN
jgi:GntR family transcriptional regulator, rspAB operon transcriptional repressor